MKQKSFLSGLVPLSYASQCLRCYMKRTNFLTHTVLHLQCSLLCSKFGVSNPNKIYTSRSENSFLFYAQNYGAGT